MGLSPLGSLSHFSSPGSPNSDAKPKRAERCAEIPYGGAGDVKRAADLYAQGWMLRQIGAELGIPWKAVGNKLRRANVTVRRRGTPRAHTASTQRRGLIEVN
jgi:hypothetical protein